MNVDEIGRKVDLQEQGLQQSLIMAQSLDFTQIGVTSSECLKMKNG